jgi:tetratricopeptide (TPR) repeat protein
VTARVDFYVDHTDTDAPWADWVEAQLVAAGYVVFRDAAVRAGENRLTRRDRALESCRHVVGLLSPAYLSGDPAVRTAAQQQVADGKERGFIPVRVAPCEPTAALGPVALIDLLGIPEPEARRRLLGGLADVAPAVTVASFPGPSPDIRFPADETVFLLGGRPASATFTGRDELLRELHSRLRSGTPTAAVQVLKGLGGVGKTRLAVEYAHRYQQAYDLVAWIQAEQPEALLADYAGLAGPLGLPALQQQSDAVAAVREELGRRSRWLLIFDNAESPAAVEELLPDRRDGHVLVTTRTPWSDAEVLSVPVLPVDAAVAYLRRRTGISDDRAARSLARALGGLPLALAQAAAVLADGVSPADYVQLLVDRSPELFNEGRPDDTDATVASTWRVALDRLAGNPIAVALMRLFAFLAPEDIPVPDLRPQAGLPADLDTALADPLVRGRAVRALTEYSLIDVINFKASVHRLVQAVVRTDLTEVQERAWADAALQVISAAFPVDAESLEQWPAAQALVPHATTVAEHAQRVGVDPLAAGVLLGRVGRYLRARGYFDQAHDLATSAVTLVGPLEVGTESVRDVHRTAAQTLQDRGEVHPARAVLERVYAAEVEHSGAASRRTLAVGRDLIESRLLAGDIAASMALDVELLPIHRESLGAEDRDTLTAEAYHAALIWKTGHQRDALRIEERVAEARARLLGPEHPDTLLAIEARADTLLGLAEVMTARQLIDEVLETRSRQVGPDHPSVLDARMRKAALLSEEGAYSEALVLQSEVYETRVRLLGRTHLMTIDTLDHLAGILTFVGNYAQARKLQEEVIEVRTRVLGAGHPDTTAARSGLAGILLGLGDFVSARALHEKVLAEREVLLGPAHPETLAAERAVAEDLHLLGHFTQARERLTRVLDSYIELFGPEHPVTLLSRSSMASFLWTTGEHSAALAEQRDICAVRRQLHGVDHPSTIQCQVDLASVLHDTGELIEARDTLRQALAAATRLLGEWHETTFAAVRSLGRTLFALGEYGRAHEMAERAVDLSSRHRSPAHPSTLSARADLGLSLLNSGDAAAARKILAETLEDARRLLGGRHSVTTACAWNLVNVHMARSNFPAARMVIAQELSWLRRASRDTISAEQQMVKKEIMQVGHRNGRRKT